MSDHVEEILRQVAAGELSPEQALSLIDAAQQGGAPGDGPAPDWGTPSTPGTPAAGGAGGPETERTSPGREGPASDVRISISYRSADIVADPAVAQVSVTGSHSVRREGGTLVVESTTFDGFSEFGSSVRMEGGGAWSFLPRTTSWARGLKGEHITIRVNPALPITVDAAGAALQITGCEGGARIRAVAASLKLDRLTGPLELDALTSSVKGSATVTGTSRISGESASVKLVLLPGSDVRVSASGSRLGKIVLPGMPSPGAGGTPESVVGTGDGRLTIDGVMSSITLTTLDQGSQRASA